MDHSTASDCDSQTSQDLPKLHRLVFPRDGGSLDLSDGENWIRIQRGSSSILEESQVFDDDVNFYVSVLSVSELGEDIDAPSDNLYICLDVSGDVLTIKDFRTRSCRDANDYRFFLARDLQAHQAAPSPGSELRRRQLEVLSPGDKILIQGLSGSFLVLDYVYETVVHTSDDAQSQSNQSITQDSSQHVTDYHREKSTQESVGYLQQDVVLETQEERWDGELVLGSTYSLNVPSDYLAKSKYAIKAAVPDPYLEQRKELEIRNSDFVKISLRPKGGDGEHRSINGSVAGDMCECKSTTMDPTPPDPQASSLAFSSIFSGQTLPQKNGSDKSKAHSQSSIQPRDMSTWWCTADCSTSQADPCVAKDQLSTTPSLHTMARLGQLDIYFVKDRMHGKPNIRASQDCTPCEISNPHAAPQTSDVILNDDEDSKPALSIHHGNENRQRTSSDTTTKASFSCGRYSMDSTATPLLGTQPETIQAVWNDDEGTSTNEAETRSLLDMTGKDLIQHGRCSIDTTGMLFLRTQPETLQTVWSEDENTSTNKAQTRNPLDMTGKILIEQTCQVKRTDDERLLKNAEGVQDAKLPLNSWNECNAQVQVSSSIGEQTRYTVSKERRNPNFSVQHAGVHDVSKEFAVTDDQCSAKPDKMAAILSQVRPKSPSLAIDDVDSCARNNIASTSPDREANGRRPCQLSSDRETESVVDIMSTYCMQENCQTHVSSEEMQAGRMSALVASGEPTAPLPPEHSADRCNTNESDEATSDCHDDRHNVIAGHRSTASLVLKDSGREVIDSNPVRYESMPATEAAISGITDDCLMWPRKSGTELTNSVQPRVSEVQQRNRVNEESKDSSNAEKIDSRHLMKFESKPNNSLGLTVAYETESRFNNVETPVEDMSGSISPAKAGKESALCPETRDCASDRQSSGSRLRKSKSVSKAPKKLALGEVRRSLRRVKNDARTYVHGTGEVGISATKIGTTPRLGGTLEPPKRKILLSCDTSSEILSSVPSRARKRAKVAPKNHSGSEQSQAVVGTKYILPMDPLPGSSPHDESVNTRCSRRSSASPSLSSACHQRNMAPRILVTGIDIDKNIKALAKKISATLITEISEAHLASHVLVNEKFKRTPKLFVGLCVTPNVVSLKWLIDSANAGTMLDCKRYAVISSEVSSNITSNLGRGEGVLHGWTVCFSPGISSKTEFPPKNERVYLIEAAGGKIVDNLPRSAAFEKLLVITSDPEKSSQTKFAQAAVVNGARKRTVTWLKELMLSQKLEI